MNNNETRLNEFMNSPYKALWTLSLPMMAGMAVQGIYMMVDTAFIGKWVGEHALAGLGYVFPLLFILIGITFGLGTGVTTVIAQLIGKGELSLVKETYLQTLWIGIFLSFSSILLGVIFANNIILFQGADALSANQALIFFKIMLIGSPFMIFGVFFRSILSGEGDNYFSMKVFGLGTLINIVLDPFFIIYFQISGAAIATVISQFIVFLLFLRKFIDNQSFNDFRLTSINLNQELLLKIIKIGLPASLSMLIMSFGILFYNILLNNANAVAALQTAGRIEHIFLLPIISIATSMVTLVGMFYGANRIDLVSKIVIYGMKWSIIISVFFSAIFFIFIEKFIFLFTDSPPIKYLAISYFKIFAFAFPFVAIGMTSSRVMQGLGHSIPMLILTIFRVIIISCLSSWYILYILNMEIEYAWYGMLFSAIATGIISFIWMWKKISHVKNAIL